MRSKSLKNKVMIQAKVDEVDALGGVVVTGFVDFAPMWAQLIPLKGEEKYISKHLTTEVNYKIRMRFRDDLNSKMRIVFGTRVFEIDSIINPFERNRELQVMASEVF